MTIDVCPICPACGYPNLGPDLCYFCRPVVAKTLPFPSPLAGPTDTAQETSAIVRSTARAPREQRADTEGSLSGSAASTLAAAG